MTWKKNLVFVMLCFTILGLNGNIYFHTYANTGININHPPHVDFTYSPDNPTDTDFVQFHDNSFDPDGWIVAWIWYFGDGNSSTLTHPRHKYTDNGIFKIDLTVIDNNGTINTTSKMITILNVPPVADCGPDRYVNQHSLNLNASQSYDIDGVIINYTWTFNETQEYYGKNVNFTLQRDGIYNLSLTVTDNDEEAANDSCTLTVDTQPPATSITITGKKGANDWYNEDVNIVLNTTDETSGIKDIKYRLDNSIWYRYKGPFNVSLQGKHTLSYYTADNAHNMEQEKAISLNIDKTEPYVKIMQPIDNHLYLLNRGIFPLPENTLIIGSVLVKIEAKDEESGIERVEFYINNKFTGLTMEPPYSWTWDKTVIGHCKLTTIIYDKSSLQSSDEIDLVAFVF